MIPGKSSGKLKATTARVNKRILNIAHNDPFLPSSKILQTVNESDSSNILAWTVRRLFSSGLKRYRPTRTDKTIKLTLEA